MAVILETSLGDITIDLLTEERPRCCLNFLKLCKMKYYNFALFHSVQRNLVAQAGDPTYTGKGGESVFYHLYGEQAKFFEAEVKPRIKHRDRGLVSMVNNGKNQHGSQFFITLAKNLDYLDGVHTVFGEVSEGFEILDKINETHTDESHRPYVDIRIYHTIILDDPFDDPAGLRIPDESPEPTKEQLESVRIAPDEEIDDSKGKSQEELEEVEKEKTAKKDAMILEMIGDLPDQDVKPPDNVLFVCKLNPVTTEEDLEIIFSRFGTINSCEVIKDQKSGESLQYAFIEFDSPDSCEKAYFKMDNVLIDDRRIHVDFSQSVSKMKWKGKGKGVEYIKSSDKIQHQKSPPRDKSRRDENEPRQKKSRRGRSRSTSQDMYRNGSGGRQRSVGHDEGQGRSKNRSSSRDRSKAKKKSKDVSRSRSRSKEKRSQKKRRGRSSSDSPSPKKSKSRRSPSPSRKKSRRSSSQTGRKSRRSPSPSPKKSRRSPSPSPKKSRRSPSPRKSRRSPSPPPRKSRHSPSASPPPRQRRKHRSSTSDSSDDDKVKKRSR